MRGPEALGFPRGPSETNAPRPWRLWPGQRPREKESQRNRLTSTVHARASAWRTGARSCKKSRTRAHVKSVRGSTCLELRRAFFGGFRRLVELEELLRRSPEVTPFFVAQKSQVTPVFPEPDTQKSQVTPVFREPDAQKSALLRRVRLAEPDARHKSRPSLPSPMPRSHM